MVRREPDGPRVILDVVETKGSGVLDEGTQDAPADGDVPDEFSLLSPDTSGYEFGDLIAGSEHANRSVASFGHLHRELHDALENGRERELGGERQTCLDQQVSTIATISLPDARQPSTAVSGPS